MLPLPLEVTGAQGAELTLLAGTRAAHAWAVAIAEVASRRAVTLECAMRVVAADMAATAAARPTATATAAATTMVTARRTATTMVTATVTGVASAIRPLPVCRYRFLLSAAGNTALSRSPVSFGTMIG